MGQRGPEPDIQDAIQVAAKVPERQVTILDRIAARRGTSRAEVIRDAILDYIKEEAAEEDPDTLRAQAKTLYDRAEELESRAEAGEQVEGFRNEEAARIEEAREIVRDRRETIRYRDGATWGKLFKQHPAFEHMTRREYRELLASEGINPDD